MCHYSLPKNIENIINLNQFVAGSVNFRQDRTLGQEVNANKLGGDVSRIFPATGPARQLPAKPIMIDLPSRSIHFGKMGQKLAAGVGSGADTEDREIEEATGIAKLVAVYLCLQK
ncbi:predicted protein [Postia placenta Mad-698-R]|nr:predicted protein [Postia placenta Mad-698-R]